MSPQRDPVLRRISEIRDELKSLVSEMRGMRSKDGPKDQRYWLLTNAASHAAAAITTINMLIGKQRR